MKQKLFMLLTALVLSIGIGWAELVVKWGDPTNYSISSELVDGFSGSTIYFWENASSAKFIKIAGKDINSLSSSTVGNEINMFVKVLTYRNYSDGNGGTVVGPNEGEYVVEVPAFCYGCESEERPSDGSSFYGTFSTTKDECVVGYSYVNGYYGNGRCNQSSLFVDGVSLISIIAGRIVVEEGANGTMFLQYFNGSGNLLLTIGEDSPEKTIIVESANPSLGSVEGSGTYTTGSNATISATATMDGYEFVQWNDGNTDNPRVINVTRNATYTATFDVIRPKYTITTGVNDANMGSVTSGGTYRQGTEITLTATAYDGYKFAKWQKDGVDIAGNATMSVTIDAAATYTAVFEEQGIIEINATILRTVNNSTNAFYLTGSDDNGYSFRFNPNNKAFPSSMTTREYTSSEISLSSCYLNLNNSSISISSIDAPTLTRVNSSDNTSYYFEATYNASNGNIYHITGIFSTNDNSDTSPNWTDFTRQQITSVTQDGANIMYMQVFKEQYGSWDRELYVKFKVPSDAYNAGYIPTNKYKVGNFNNETTYVLQGNGTVSSRKPNPSSARNYYNNSNIRYWFFRMGTVEIINPNHENIPLWFDVQVQNSKGTSIVGRMGTKPALRTVTFDGTTDFGTATMQPVGDAAINGQYYEGAWLNLTAPAATGNYEFKGWYNGSTRISTSLSYQYTVGSSNNLKAVYGLKTRQVTIDTPTNGSIVVTDGSGNVISNGDMVEYGTVLTVTTTPSTGYHLDAWTTGTGYVTPDADGNVTVNGDIKLGATFAINQYTITVGATENGAIKVAQGDDVLYNGNEGDSFEVDYGTELTLTAVPDQGYVFNTWTNEEEGGGLDAPKRVGFESSIPFVNEGEAMVLTEDQLTSNPLVITIDGDLNIGAMFEMLPPFTVTIHDTYDGYISVSDGETTVTNQDGEKVVEFPQNAELTLTLHPDNSDNQYVDYGEWVNNYDDDVAYSEEQERVVTLTEDMDLYADFMMKEFTIYESGVEANYEDLPKEVLIRRVTLVRTFKKGTWSTMCLPFDNYVGDNAQLSGKIHEMFNAEVSGNKVDVYFNRVNAISAGYPYMYYSSESGVTNPVFNYVYVEEGVTAQKPNCGDMTYCGVLTSFVLPAHDDNYRYISSNKLYYPTKDYPVPFDRGYFEINKAFSNAPIRMFVEDSMIEEADQPEEIGTKKYIEDGILVIERNDVKYNAQGQVID